MPVLLNTATGKYETLADDMAQRAVQAGTHELPVVSPEGQLGSTAYADAPSLLKNGYTQPSQQQLQGLLDESKYSGGTQQAKAGLLGAAEGVAGPLATYGAKKLGLTDQDIQGLKTYNPGTHMAGQIAGLVGSSVVGVGEGALLAKAGELAAGASKAAGAGKLLSGAARGAVENALFQSGDELSQRIVNDPAQTTETAISNIGMAGLLGGALGYGAAGLGKLAGIGGEGADRFVEDFKSRLDSGLKNPDMVGKLTDELGNVHSSTNEAAKEVWGPNGLKAQDLQAVMPEDATVVTGKEGTTKPVAQAQDLKQLLNSKINEMAEQSTKYPEYLVNHLKDYVTELDKASDAAPTELYKAIDDIKKRLGSFQYDYAAAKPTSPAYYFVKSMQDIRKPFEQALEDTKVWGAAGERQRAINKAFAAYKQPLEDFERRFTTELNGKRVVDPGKVNTYLNQLGKPNAEIKQESLKNYLDAVQKYRGAISDIHDRLKIASPLEPVSLEAANSSVEKVTPGAAFADKLLKHGSASALSRLTGAAIGAGVAGPAGAAAGAVIGPHAIGPLFDHIMPAILRRVADLPGSGAGLRDAVQFGGKIVRGENLLGKTVKATVEGGTAAALAPDVKQREKLKEHLDELQQNPEQMLQIGGQLGHYMPDHATNLGMIAQRNVQYLQSLKPNTQPPLPLDKELVPSSTQDAAYNRALDIANNPMLVLSAAQKGMLTTADLTHLSVMYPQLLKRMQGQISQALTNKKHNLEAVPYKTRLSLSAIMAQPLDSTMTPQSIQSSMRVAPMAPMAPSQPKAGARHSMASLSKLSATYSTPQQARQQYRANTPK